MNSEEGGHWVPTGEEIDAERRDDAQIVATHKSWVQKMKLRAHIGAGRRVEPPPIKPSTARDADIRSTAESAGPSSPPPGTRVTSDLPSRPLSTGGA
jgi:hypothetical protein